MYVCVYIYIYIYICVCVCVCVCVCLCTYIHTYIRMYSAVFCALLPVTFLVSNSDIHLFCLFAYDNGFSSDWTDFGEVSYARIALKHRVVF
jgi:hypothetical protein